MILIYGLVDDFLTLASQSGDMAAPTGSDGLRRAVEEFMVPSAGLVLLVVLMKEFMGPVMAGMAYLLLTVPVLLGIFTAAKYWNPNYLGVFVVAGIALLFVAPSFISELLHPVVGFLEAIIVLAFLVGLGHLFVEKSRLDRS